MKKIIMFHRSNDGSTVIASATKKVIAESSVTKKQMEVELINLDKRNYKKYLEKNKDILSDCNIYIYNDEENLMDYINDNFQGIEYKTYSKEEAKRECSRYNDFCFSYVADRIIREYRESFGSITLWRVADDKIEKVVVLELDYNNGMYEIGFYFKTKEKALDFLGFSLKNQILKEKHYIEKSKERVKKYEKLLKELIE